MADSTIRIAGFSDEPAAAAACSIAASLRRHVGAPKGRRRAPRSNGSEMGGGLAPLSRRCHRHSCDNWADESPRSSFELMDVIGPTFLRTTMSRVGGRALFVPG